MCRRMKGGETHPRFLPPPVPESPGDDAKNDELSSRHDLLISRLGSGVPANYIELKTECFAYSHRELFRSWRLDGKNQGRYYKLN